jgi:hypothetical protein
MKARTRIAATITGGTGVRQVYKNLLAASQRHLVAFGG